MGYPFKANRINFCPLCGAFDPVFNRTGRTGYFRCDKCGSKFEVNDYERRYQVQTQGNPIPERKATLAYERYVTNRTRAKQSIVSFAEWLKLKNYVLR